MTIHRAQDKEDWALLRSRVSLGASREGWGSRSILLFLSKQRQDVRDSIFCRNLNNREKVVLFVMSWIPLHLFLSQEDLLALFQYDCSSLRLQWTSVRFQCFSSHVLLASERIALGFHPRAVPQTALPTLPLPLGPQLLLVFKPQVLATAIIKVNPSPSLCLLTSLILKCLFLPAVFMSRYFKTPAGNCTGNPELYQKPRYHHLPRLLCQSTVFLLISYRIPYMTPSLPAQESTQILDLPSHHIFPCFA